MTEEEVVFSKEQSRELVFLLTTLISAAHIIIEAAIEGEKLRASRLENYYSNWQEIMMLMGKNGELIDADNTLDGLQYRLTVEPDTGHLSKFS